MVLTHGAGSNCNAPLFTHTAVSLPANAGCVIAITSTVSWSDPVQPAPSELFEMAQGMLEEGTVSIPGIGSDIADPDSTETAYAETPIGPFLSLTEGLRAMQADIATIHCPVLILNSPQDHVVEPSNSDFLAATVAGPVERVTLERSYHVATLDYDRDIIFEHAVAFAERVCAA